MYLYQDDPPSTPNRHWYSTSRVGRTGAWLGTQLTLSLWALSAIGVGISALLVVLGRRARGVSPGHCSSCAYDCRSLPHDAASSECGRRARLGVVGVQGLTLMPTVPNWESNATLESLAEWLRGKRRVVLLTHAKVDGDAFGASLALARALKKADESGGSAWGKTVARPCYVGPMPDWCALLANKEEFGWLEGGAMPSLGGAESPEPDALVVVDTGSWSQLKEVEPWVRPRRSMSAIIDHHRKGDGDVADRRVIVPEAAAACQLVAELCRLLLRRERIEELPKDVATPLYLGLATDTGWFHHSNVTPEVMHLAARLLGAGVDHTWLFETVERQDRPARLRLMSKALNSLELLDHDRVAVMTLTQQDFHDAHATPTDSGGFVDIPLSVARVQVSVLITQMYTSPGGKGPEITKVSFRAKAGTVDVNAVAGKLGGGGHVQAAGAKMEMPLEAAKKRIVEALR